MPDFEYAVRCPNGVQQLVPSGWTVQELLALRDKSHRNACGPHTVLRRSLAWEEVPGDE